MTEPALAPSALNLLRLPQDVQLSILLAFNIRELVICKRVCRSLADFIDDHISIRYEIELARTGKIDGTPSVAVPVIDRLIALREHRTRFRAGHHPLKHLRGQPFGSQDALSSNGVVTTVTGGIIYLWRPASTFSGIGELKIAYSMRELGLEGFNAGTCVADVSQDLLFFSRKYFNSTLRDCFIYSLSKGRPHLHASQSYISSSFVSDEWQDYRSWDSIQVLGDLFAWNVPHPSDARQCEMRVINWKTGVTVWEFHGGLLSRCRLISQSHVVVITIKSLLLYPIDRHRRSPSAPSTSDTALYILQLPVWSSILGLRYLQVKSYIQFPPPTGRNDRLLYRHDPDLTLLTLQIHYIVDTSEYDLEFVQYAMFIPISTLKTYTGATTRSPPPPCGPPHVVQWEDWGPAGTRIVPLDSKRACSFSPMGCSCAITRSQRAEPSGQLSLTVFVFDVHPWATPDPQRAGERRRFEHLAEQETRSGPAFTEAVRTSFPFDVTRREISCQPHDRRPTVVLTEDGLLLVTSPEDA